MPEVSDPRNIKNILGVIAAFVAVATFMFSVFTNYGREKEDEIRSWQKTAVFDVLTSSKEDVLSFNKIRESYVTKAQTYVEHDIPKNELSEASTKRILLELIRDGALVQKSKDEYAVAVQREDLLKKESMSMLRQLGKNAVLTNKLLTILAQSPGAHDVKQLVGALSKQATISAAEASGVVSQAISRRLIFIHPGEKFKTFLIADAPQIYFAILMGMVPPQIVPVPPQMPSRSGIRRR